MPGGIREKKGGYSDTFLILFVFQRWRVLFQVLVIRVWVFRVQKVPSVGSFCRRARVLQLPAAHVGRGPSVSGFVDLYSSEDEAALAVPRTAKA